MDDSAPIDVFISHHPADATAARSLASTLSASGLRVHCGAPPTEWPERNTDRLAGLARTKAFIAWISPAYCAHAAAQREFMLAFGAAGAMRQLRERIVAIDALHDGDAALPQLLRKHCQIESPRDFDGTARRLRAQLEAISNPLGPVARSTFDGMREFTGRIGHLWHLHEVLTSSRAACLTGEPGAGKSWLADEYADTFQNSYPGGTFRLDAGWLEHASDTDIDRMREFAWRQVALQLRIETRGLTFDRIEKLVRQRLEEPALDYLWIIDHVPGGIDIDSVRAWRAPTPRGATVFISRFESYTGLGTQIVVGPIDPASARALLAHHKPMATPQEQHAGRQLLEQLGHHALSLQLTASRLPRSSYDRMLLQIAAPSTQAAQLADALAEQLPHPQLVGIAVTLHRTIVQLGAPARHALRLAAVLANAPVPLALLTTALAQQGRGSASHSVSHSQLALDELLGFGLAQRCPNESLSITPLVRAATLTIDKQQELAAARDLLIATLAGELPQAPDADDRNPYIAWLPHILHLTRGAAPSAPLVELNAWLARFDQLGALRSGNRRAVSMLERGDLHRAEELLDMELAASRLGLGEGHPQTATPVNNLAVALTLRGEFSQARTLLEQAVDVRRKALGEQHIDVLTPLNNLGVVLWHEGEHRKARTILERVVELRRQLLGDTHPDTLVSMRNLAVVLRNDGEFVIARNLLEHVVEVRRASLGVQHVDTCTAMASLATTLREHSEAILAKISDTLSIDAPLLAHDQIVRTA